MHPPSISRNEQLATGVKIVECVLKHVCECGMKGKSARLPFPPVSERKSSQIFDIFHTDLCALMRNVTPKGNRYVMNIIDGFSRFTVTCLLKSMKEAADRIKNYVCWTKIQFTRKLEVFRSDGGWRIR